MFAKGLFLKKKQRKRNKTKKQEKQKKTDYSMKENSVFFSESMKRKLPCYNFPY